MDTDKAYLLGLIIGGGIFGNAEDVFRIRLPYNKWGSYAANPQRAGDIAADILKTVGQMFRAVYDVTVQYETQKSGTWTILCEGDLTDIRADLIKYGIECEGELRKNVSIDKLTEDLVDDNLKRRFIAGLADTIGSTAKSHRRFSDEHQILSFEIPGYNYKFVCDLCKLLYSVNCIPDQINWNHPNIHCTQSPYYKQWNKGFKLRILLDQYAQFGAFAFRTKAESSIDNRKLQKEKHEAEKCETRDTKMTISSVHPAENNPNLPDVIRGGHYLNFRHFCAVLGCEHAPYSKICACFNKLGDLITPFPILWKDTLENINPIIDSDPLLSERDYTTTNLKIKSLLSDYNEDKERFLFGDGVKTGYPLAELLQAVAYIIADDDELGGKRPRGSYIEVIEKHLRDNSDLTIEIRKPEILTPLLVVGNGKGAMIGARNPDVYERLVSIAPDNKYKLIVRQITVEDLQNG